MGTDKDQQIGGIAENKQEHRQEAGIQYHLMVPVGMVDTERQQGQQADRAPP